MSSRGPLDLEAILSGLNEEQLQAATAVTGPVVILAGAGTGKTRVISHRIAYGVASGAIDERRTLVVSFTNKAADEMAVRLRRLGLPRATALTLHAAAKRQLVHFWPARHGRPLPEPRESKLPILVPLIRQLPGHYRYTPAKDLADEVEWAKNRRVPPERYLSTAKALGREARVPADLMARLYADYERGKSRAGVFDFEDLLEQAIRLYEADPDALALVRQRFAWFSVDEYQDTNPLQQALLDLWVGDRRDIAVVGDPNQTIYTFTGATPDYLLGFSRRFPDATIVTLDQNYRSTPQILHLANQLVSVSAGPRLRATHPDGPEPQIKTFSSDEYEVDWLAREIGACLSDGLAPSGVAVLTRTNYQLEPVAAGLRAAGIPFHFKGTPFYELPEVRAAIRALRPAADGDDVVSTALEQWRKLGFDPDAPMPDDPRAASTRQAFETLHNIARAVSARQPGAGVADLLAEFDRQVAIERDATAEGVTLSTIHGAKGAEWPAVFIPMLEEGNLPIHHAFRSPEAVEEERRLLYVAITRAQQRLALSWAGTRDSPKGKTERRKMSRFLEELRPRLPAPKAPPLPILRPGDRVRHPRHGLGWVRGVTKEHAAVDFDSGRSGNVERASLRVVRDGSRGTDESTDGLQRQVLVERLMEWRRDRARHDGVPAYVVAHDAHLRAVAEHLPSTEAALMEIPGFGQVKVERYGADILAIVRAQPH